MKLYPPGFNLYRSSRGVERPKIYKVTEEQARKYVGDASLTYEKTIAVTDGAGETQNVVNYRTYNRKSKPPTTEKKILNKDVTDKGQD